MASQKRSGWKKFTVHALKVVYTIGYARVRFVLSLILQTIIYSLRKKAELSGGSFIALKDSYKSAENEFQW